jgi:hypothetical protein
MLVLGLCVLASLSSSRSASLDIEVGCVELKRRRRMMTEDKDELLNRRGEEESGKGGSVVRILL